MRKVRVALRRNRWLQIGWLIALWWLADAAVRAAGVPVPGSVVGMGVLLLLLTARRVPASWFRRGASGLHDHLLLFFVPACMSLLDHRELFTLVGLKILAVCVAGTLLVMISTAFIIEACVRWSLRRAA